MDTPAGEQRIQIIDQSATYATSSRHETLTSAEGNEMRKLDCCIQLLHLDTQLFYLIKTEFLSIVTNIFCHDYVS